MLRPELLSIEIGPELRRRIEPAVFQPLFKEAGRARTRSLSITQAKELLAIAVPEYREVVSEGFSGRFTSYEKFRHRTKRRPARPGEARVR